MVAKKYKDKESLVGALHSKLDSASAIVITEYRGLKAGDLVKLRRSLRDAKVEVVVVKNSLLRRAAVGTQAEGLVSELAGPTAIALGYGEAIEAAKLLAKGEKDFEPFNLGGGVIEKSVLDASGVAAVAKLPGRTEMQSQFAGALEGVVAEFAFVVEAVIREFVGLVEAKVEADGGAAA
jgi:large subunit ribosomal protein L10